MVFDGSTETRCTETGNTGGDRLNAVDTVATEDRVWLLRLWSRQIAAPRQTGRRPQAEERSSNGVLSS